MKLTFTDWSLLDCTPNNLSIDIWQFSLDTLFKGTYELLSEDEKIRANRYHFSRHQRRFTVARATLRLILARYTQQLPQELEFTYNKYGKPQLKHTAAIEFNLSHSRDMALLAVGKKFPLGIDVEYFSERPYEGIGKHLFSLQENQALNKAPLNIQPLIFFNIWSQKEAFIKATGLGLAYPTQQFDVPAFPPTDQQIKDSLHQQEWKMLSFMPEIACNAALCYHPSIEIIHYAKLEGNIIKALKNETV